ncbi:MAG: hypothetical protein AAFV85_21995 [Cyanobacteria bacterium J06634_6]
MASSRTQFSFPSLVLRSALMVSAIASIYLLQQLNDSNALQRADIISALPSLNFLR